MTDIELERVYSRIADKAVSRRKVGPVVIIREPIAIVAATIHPTWARIQEELRKGWSTQDRLKTMCSTGDSTIKNWLSKYDRLIEKRDIRRSTMGRPVREYRMKGTQ